MTTAMPAIIEIQTQAAAEVIDVTAQVQAQVAGRRGPRRREIEVRLLAEA
jgi:hypothetical protein